MGLLDGRNALVFGVANDHSLPGASPGVPRRGRGGRLLVGREPHREARPAARGLDRLDVRRALRRGRRRQIARVFDRWGETHDGLDILVHALAFAKREELDGAFVDTSREGFALALDISAYSLVGLPAPRGRCCGAARRS
jgi:enoyl-[acyl-carrier protein] reductase I